MSGGRSTGCSRILPTKATAEALRDVTETESYTVEKILCKDTVQNLTQYLVRTQISPELTTHATDSLLTCGAAFRCAGRAMDRAKTPGSRWRILKGVRSSLRSMENS
jgi:hypothetical protein